MALIFITDARHVQHRQLVRSGGETKITPSPRTKSMSNLRDGRRVASVSRWWLPVASETERPKGPGVAPAAMRGSVLPTYWQTAVLAL